MAIKPAVSETGQDSLTIDVIFLEARPQEVDRSSMGVGQREGGAGEIMRNHHFGAGDPITVPWPVLAILR